MKRIGNRIKRELLKLPVFQFIWNLAYKVEVKKHIIYLPATSPVDYTLVDCLKREAVSVTSLELLKLPSTPLLIDSVKRLLPNLQAISAEEKNAISLDLSQHLDYPYTILWGLEERLLNIVENYIGLPVLYLGADLRREVANGKAAGIRQWHLDIETHRMIKIIVYFSNVNADNGPFEYIPKSSTLLLSQALKYSSGFIQDETMNAVSPSNQKSCTGPSGTVIFADTCNVFHRAKAPVLSDRFSITFAYTSRKFIKAYHVDKFSKDDYLVLSQKLSERQKECVLGSVNL